MNEYYLWFPWIILFLPLVAAVLITLVTRPFKGLSAALSIGAIVISFLLSLALFIELKGESVPTNWILPWISLPGLYMDIGMRLDGLSQMMLLIVTGVGSAIHIYSWGYMHEDRNVSRYFASLSLFTFSMLGIVLASNFMQMFIFWELVGLSSYLLIGFWYERPAAADASKKAFLANRLGDFGFLFGIILIWSILDSLNFEVLADTMQKNPEALGKWATLAGLAIFCGALGKSAQFPLHVWLPDAMEGPTPVSALIHAATMVAAGVYMLCRVFFLFNVPTLEVIAYIGGFTSLLAALIAVQQNDIKRILAYSTLSQLGYMVMAVGLEGPTAAMYHLTTHAFFKALLFLGAGSVIHALHHEQDIWNMGGLKKKMPVTFWTFLIGTLALSGVPPFSGFFSKDEILVAAYNHNLLLFVVAVFVAVLTTFYMFRLIFVAFLGNARSESASHAHESPPILTWPLMVLAVPSALAGFFGIERLFAAALDPKAAHHVHAAGVFDTLFHPFTQVIPAFSGLFAVVVGFTAAYGLYGRATRDPLPSALGFFASAMRNRFWFDEIYSGLIAATQGLLARLADAIDRWIIAGLMVKGLHGTTELAGRALRLVQTGNLQTYAFLFAGGLAVVLYFVLFRP